MPTEQPDERRMLRKNLLFSKLFGEPSYGSLDRLLRDADDLDIPFRRRFHRIIVAEVETWGELLSRTETRYDPDDRSEAYFVLSNICSEMFSMDGACHVCYTDFQGRIVFWLDADDDCCETALFRQAAEHAARVTEAEFRMVVTFSIGPWFEDLFSTFWVYQSILNLLFYFRYLSDQRSVYTMEHLPEKATPMTLSGRGGWERHLLDTLRDGNFEGVKTLLQEYYRRRFFEDAVTLEVFPQRRASFTELLEITAVELLQRYPAAEVPGEAVFRIISTAETAQAQLDAVEQLVDEIVARLQPGNQEPAPDWVGDLVEYVQKNYSDPNITVYLLAERAGLTPSYCTRIFRRHMGMSLLEYIQRQRIRAATGLLEAGKTMSETAHAAGFTCTQTLRRTLKQYRAQ